MAPSVPVRPPGPAGPRAAWLLGLVLGVLGLAGARSPQDPAAGAPGPGDAAPRRPNVVFVLVDDLGWRDLGCYGSTRHRTPHLDRLAEEGVRFTDAYAAHAMCMASRLGFVTGRYPARTRGPSGGEEGGDGGNDGGSEAAADGNGPGSSRSAQTLLPEAFQAAGYATFLAGKWHLHRGGLDPAREGFDVVVGSNEKGAAGSYFHPYGDPGTPNALPDLAEGGARGEYLTDRLTEETLDFVRAHRDEPFFVLLAHYAVHKPLQGKPDVVARYREAFAADPLRGPRRGQLGKTHPLLHQENPTYAAMVESVDDSVGALVRELARLGLLDDTLLVVTSDNGGAVTSTSNAPLKGGKQWLFEGGVRVPLLLRFPGRATPGHVSAFPTIGTDHYPTLLELAGLDPLPEQHLDGVSYAAALRADAEPPVRGASLYWHFPVGGRLRRTLGTEPSSVVRDGRWKLIEWYERGAVELFDLEADPGEARDLAREHPEVARELRSRLQVWRAEVDAPMEPVDEDTGE